MNRMMPGNLGENIKFVVVKSHSRKPGDVITNSLTGHEPGLNDRKRKRERASL